MRANTSKLRITLSVILALTGALHAQSDPGPKVDPTGTAGALKAQVETGGGYDPNSGNASRSVTDLRVPGAAGMYGLDFTRHWNSTRSDLGGDSYPVLPFGGGGWTHSWNIGAVGDVAVDEGPDGGNVCKVTYTLKVHLPDGSSAGFSFYRSYMQCPEDEYAISYPSDWAGDDGVAHRLREMTPDGGSFWLYLADGGSIHFVGSIYGYLATEVFDPHGLRTELEYIAGKLRRVVGPDGRELRFVWKTQEGEAYQVLGSVESGTGLGLQRVSFVYGAYTTVGEAVNSTWIALSEVTYEGDIDPNPNLPANTPFSAKYSYTAYVSRDLDGFAIRGRGPILTQADDPRVDGVMTKIKYVLRGGPGGGRLCPSATDTPQHTGLWTADFFFPTGFPIESERSANTGFVISELSIPCNGFGAGGRVENRGAGGSRRFSYGHSAGTEPGSSSAYGATYGYQLVKVTDFADDPAASGTPFQFQGYYQGYPKRIWDARGILSEIIRTPSATNPNQHDWSGRISEIRNVGSDGSKRLYDWSNPGTSEARNTSLIRNTFNHWLFSQTDENNNKTLYTRDSRRRIKRIDHPGPVVSFEEFTYNDFNNEIFTHRLASDALKTNNHYPAGHIWQGLLSNEWNSVDGWEARKEYTYDSFGRVWTMQDGIARLHEKPFSVRLTYNARHQVVMEEYPATDGSPTNPTKEYQYDAYGNCTGIKNELGAWSTYTYDEYRRCTSYTEPLNAPNWQGVGTVASRTWKWHYDRYSDATGLRDASTHTSKQWRVQVEPAFNAACDRRLTAHKYDYNDQIIETITGMIEKANGDWATTADTAVSLFTYDANGNKKTFVDSRGRTTEYEYDQRDRLVKTTEHPMPNASPSAARVTEMSYDQVGNKLSVKFPDQTLQRWELYNPFGQARRFIDERNQTTDLSYQWGPMKKLNTVTTYRTRDPASGGGLEPQLTNFDPDELGRPKWIYFPDGSSERTTYEYGQAVEFKTRKNQIKTIVYDARGREDYHVWGGNAAPGIDRTWDDANRLTGISNIFSAIDYKYDDAGQVWWEENTITGSGVPMQTEFYRYPSGEVGNLRHPHGLRLRKAYTARGQLETIGLNDSANRLVDYYYLPDGKVDYSTYWNGVSTTRYGYDGRGMINSIHHLKTTESPQGPSLAFRKYWRDSRDRITAWQRGTNTTLNGKEVGDGDKFQYDAEGQLTDAWYLAQDPGGNMHSPLVQEHFQYDQLGNRFGSNQTISYGTIDFLRRDNGLNQYASWTPSVISHDDNHPGWSAPGNGVLMADGFITASYNALNQPRAIWSPTYAGTPNYVWFGFDPLGRCVKRWVGPLVNGGYPPPETNPATYFLYDGWNMIEEGPGGGGVARVYAHGARVDEVVASSNEFGAVLFHHYDALGNCILLSDGAGNLSEQYDYEAFGKPYFYNTIGTNIPESTWKNRYLGKGREWLADLKLYDYRHRLYQPELGRFLQPDPKHFAAGDYNLYRYCHNDPVNHTDPTGLDLRIDSFQPYDVQVKIQAIIDRVSQTAEGAAAIQTMRDSPFDNVILGTLPGLDSSESTIARNGANQDNGVGSGAIITIPTSDTVNVRSDGTKETLPPSVTAGHGFGHGASINKGTQAHADPNAKGADYIKQPSESKSDSIKVENAVRKLEKLRERD